jgi:4-amino-4-deoxy-L-arabinose transferase-like glycosyltransferase
LTKLQHAARIGLLLAGAAVLLGWMLSHSEATFADGLRYIHRAERIDHGVWTDAVVHGIDHPLHPLGIVAAHRLLGGTDPASWQRAALLLCAVSAVLLVIPVYLLALELFGEQAAWLACIVVMVNPIIAYIVVNVLSESTFLLWWTFGLWGAVRFFREGRFLWLPLAIGFAALAYLTRPEGLLLPAAVVLALLLLPLSRATRINWPRWWRALAFLGTGFAFSVGPYMAVKGGLGTKPGIARVLGLAPRSDPLGLERERPLPPDQTTAETYRIAIRQMFKVVRWAVTPPLFPVALFGLAVAGLRTLRTRAWLFLGIILVVSAIGLVRLHATGGYCTVRHGLIPGMIFTLAAAHGLAWLVQRAAIPGRWMALAHEQIRPGPAVWAVLLALCVVYPNTHSLDSFNSGPFSTYHTTGKWIAQHAASNERVLDLTDWSLYFSQRPGYSFAHVYEAPSDPRVRWIVARKIHLEGRWHYSRLISGLVARHAPVAIIPPAGDPDRQVRIYDLQAAAPQTAASTSANLGGPDTRLR